MYNIRTLNKISQKGISCFDDKYNCSDTVENPDAIVVRSASMHDMEMPENLLAIARAGAGVNNIPVEKCAEKGVVVFNTPGANANAVKELVIAGLLLSSRKIIDGIAWAQTLKGNGDNVAKMVEKGKSNFAGPELKGKKLGIIGLGAIGILVANACTSLGMDVYGHDPFLSVDAAWKLSRHIQHAKSLEEIYANCDYISIHIPLNDKTKHFIDGEAISKMKKGVKLLNYSRAGLVNNDDVLKALESGQVSTYVTDFATDELLGVDGIIAIPHLGASTPESEENCAVMAVDEVKDYLENGNIVNSVNYPSVVMPRTDETRVCILHKNKPKLLSRILKFIGEKGGNVENMENKSRGDYAYTVIDSTEVDENVSKALEELEDVIRVRVIR